MGENSDCNIMRISNNNSNITWNRLSKDDATYHAAHLTLELLRAGVIATTVQILTHTILTNYVGQNAGPFSYSIGGAAFAISAPSFIGQSYSAASEIILGLRQEIINKLIPWAEVLFLDRKEVYYTMECGLANVLAVTGAAVAGQDNSLLDGLGE